MDDGFTPGGGGGCGGGENELNDDGVCEVCAFWRELASYKSKADGTKQLPVAASDDSLSIPREVGSHLRNMIPEFEPDKLQEKDLHNFRSTEQVIELSSSDDDDDDMVRGGTRESCTAQMRVTHSCAKKQKITSKSSPSRYGAHKPHDRAPLGGSYILKSGATLSLQAKKKVEEKVQAIRPKFPIFVKVMTRSSVDGTGCKTCEMLFSSEYGEYLPNKSQKLALQLEGKERQWQATLDIRSNICFLQRRISKGWKEFSGQNGLEVGDICLFKLEDTNTTSLKMTVYLIRKSQIEL